ncbi:MAG TPA: hypothetical protein VM869_13385 [Enhygromyxa sp.]|nr:hypothetical protein [Enhygromyxa sp.]
MTECLRIGVVGFSQRHFDHEAARAHLRRLVTTLLERPEAQAAPPEIVSGLTNQGVPKLAYELARELGLVTVGIAARQALRVRAGLFPVDRKILVGERFGDESHVLIDYIDKLIRVGGGPQSRAEVELFRAKCKHDDGVLSDCLFEAEVEWYGPDRRRRSPSTAPQ